jgi:hypothetical protein
VQGVVEAVAKGQPFWAELTLEDRARYLERAAQVVIDESDDIRDLIVREQGKPRNEAFAMELLPTIDALHWIARAGIEILADEKIPMPQIFLKTKSSAFVYEPLGVVGIISPWNYPWSIPVGEVALALMAGNGVVLKPASLTPLIGERIRKAFERAGVPEGLVRLVHGPGTGSALVESRVAKLFFTGSVKTGRRVGEACARELKGSVLELGGKDAMVVLSDASVDHAVAGALWAGFANAGQTCSGVERVYVAREVSERFLAGLVEGARRLRIGDPMRWETEIGPMVSREQFEVVSELVDDALAAGAQEALQAAGNVSAVLQRPHALVIKRPAPTEQLVVAVCARWGCVLAEQLVAAGADRRRGVRLLVRVDSDRDQPFTVLSSAGWARGPPADRPHIGATSHASISHANSPRPTAGDTTGVGQLHSERQRDQESAHHRAADLTAPAGQPTRRPGDHRLHRANQPVSPHESDIEAVPVEPFAGARAIDHARVGGAGADLPAAPDHRARPTSRHRRGHGPTPPLLADAQARRPRPRQRRAAAQRRARERPPRNAVAMSVGVLGLAAVAG